MSETTVPSSIISRVKKLLALAGNNSNENEANAAAQKVQEILAKYNLELSELGDGNPSVDAERVQDGDSLDVRADWQATLMSAIAEANFCSHWTSVIFGKRADGTGSNRKRRRHSLIGRKVNVTIVKEIYVYLSSTMERLCPYTDKRDRSARSWYEGCSDRLRSRLQEQRQESEAASRTRRADAPRGDGSSLVLSDVYSSEEDLNNDLRYGYAPGTTAARKVEAEARHQAYMEEWRRRQATTPVVVDTVVVKAETAREREKRERAANRWEEQYRRRQEREASKVDQYAYSQGASAGRGIGLDRQVRDSGPAKKIG